MHTIIRHLFLWSGILPLLIGIATPTHAQTDFICGVDVSYLQQIEDAGGIFYDANGQEVDALAYFEAQGVNYVRLRLWHTPTDGHYNLDYAMSMAKQIKALGMKFLLDFHYSDTWADPANQTKPAAWAELSYVQLRTALFHYTIAVLEALNQQGTPPDMVQIGNEIAGGFLWEEGSLRGNDNWLRFNSLLGAGARAVRQTVPDAQIMLHIETGGNRVTSQWFFDHVIEGEVDFDIIGLSYYPWWSGSLDDLQTNLTALANRYNKPIIVVETAYPWTLDWSDNTHNAVGERRQLETGYLATPQGQYDFLQQVVAQIQDTPNGLGSGFFYWEPDAISAPNFGSVWENLAQFDFDGRALPSMAIYGTCA